MTGAKFDRRDFLKLEATAMAAAAAGMAVPAVAANLATDKDTAALDWNKAACRFCGTGCSVMVGVKEGRVVATHGDIKAEVNRGLNCVKGYFLSKIMYGEDRLTKPLLRKKDGVYDKNGEFVPVSWDEAFDVMADKFKAALKKRGPNGVAMFGSGQWTIFEGYAAVKLFKAGFRTNNIDPNARHCMASAVAGFMRSFGIDEPMGCYDDIEATDAFVLWGSNMAEMHPILWSRVADRRLSAPHVKVAVLSTFEHRSFDLADIAMVFKPQTDLILLNAIANHIIKTGRVNKDFVTAHTVFKRGQTDIGYGLRPEHPLQKKAAGAAKPNDATDISFDEYAAFVSEYTIPKAAELTGVPANRIEALAELYADPKTKVVQFLDDGLQPAHARRLGEQSRLQSASAHRENFRAREQPIFAYRPTVRLRHGARGRHLLASLAGRHGRDQQGASRPTEEIWKLPEGTISDKNGAHAVLQNRMLKDGAHQRLLGAGQQQYPGRRQRSRGGHPGLSQPR